MAPPVSTYRVQVRPDFDLAATAGLAGYLAELGVTHLYSAPLLAAVPGSSHGYDVVDHSRVNPELGGEAGLAGLVEALRAAGLGLVVDIVPNHAGVAVPAANPAWWSVLRDGPGGQYAGWFDIDWSRGRLRIPVLADEPDGPDPLDDLKLDGDELHYFEHRYPIAPGTGAGEPREVHDRQHYQLISWRRGNTELNYRRFFAVAELAGLRVEDPAVFDATHARILDWYRRGWLAGIRVDHPDGLRDPAGYLRRLRAAAPDAWLVVEKILGAGEELADWPVDGSTGYDALREVCGLFIDPAGRPPLAESHRRLTGDPLTGDPPSYPEVVHRGKVQAATELLAAEVARLTRLAAQPSDSSIPAGPAPDRLAAALVEVAAAFAVYRGYPPAGAAALADALRLATARRPGLTAAIGTLAPRLADPADDLAARFAQLTGAVMAKGVEDTAFYRWSQCVALNEVGGTPDRFGVEPAEFHAAAIHRHEHWPASMTTLSTHDTKRAADVRARLAVLTELPAQWNAAVTRWIAGTPLPDPAFALLLWQSVVGVWPIERDRLRGYAQKAAREAAVRTSWSRPDEDFETAVRATVDACYDDPALAGEVAGFAARITPDGWSNALGQLLVQLLMPGVPDTYQGTELWDNSLVDPDNRRPVDFAARRALLARLDGGWLPPVDRSGAAKLLVLSRALRLRRDAPGRFTGYTPLAATGPAARHVLAFDRGGAIAAVTRLPVGLRRRGGWAGTRLRIPAGEWTDVLTGRPFAEPVAELFGTYPVALLVRAA